MRTPKIYLTFCGLEVNPVMLSDKTWLAEAVNAKDGDGRPLLALTLDPSYTGQEALDWFLHSRGEAEQSDAMARDTADLAWRLAEAMKVIREFPGIRLESDYNKWLFKRDRVLELGPMPSSYTSSRSSKGEGNG